MSKMRNSHIPLRTQPVQTFRAGRDIGVLNGAGRIPLIKLGEGIPGRMNVTSAYGSKSPKYKKNSKSWSVDFKPKRT